MDEREAFTAYFENQHMRKFPRQGTTATQMREALSAFLAGISYAEMLRTNREVCPQPCEHLSQEDAREGRTCAEHPCTCTNREVGGPDAGAH